jgi:dimethyladenosine transferase
LQLRKPNYSVVKLVNKKKQLTFYTIEEHKLQAIGLTRRGVACGRMTNKLHFGWMTRPTFAKKSLGQNFLTDPKFIDSIVSAVDIGSGDAVIEIGPGRGAITEKLVRSGANVTAIELDRELVPMLREMFSEKGNFSIVEGDATEIDYRSLVEASAPPASPNARSKVVANLPYYISTAILQKLSEQRDCFSSLVLMFQREVVDRITAKPGSSERGYLTVLVESAFATEKLFDVPPTAFRPQPKVWSSVVMLSPNYHAIDDPEGFRRLLSTAFAQKRKTIFNNLKGIYADAEELLSRSEIDPQRRAETLTLAEWQTLHMTIRTSN